jgi:hypothetical protein
VEACYIDTKGLIDSGTGREDVALLAAKDTRDWAEVFGTRVLANYWTVRKLLEKWPSVGQTDGVDGRLIRALATATGREPLWIWQKLMEHWESPDEIGLDQIAWFFSQYTSAGLQTYTLAGNWALSWEKLPEEVLNGVALVGGQTRVGFCWFALVNGVLQLDQWSAAPLEVRAVIFRQPLASGGSALPDWLTHPSPVA